MFIINVESTSHLHTIHHILVHSPYCFYSIVIEYDALSSRQITHVHIRRQFLNKTSFEFINPKMSLFKDIKYVYHIGKVKHTRNVLTQLNTFLTDSIYYT